jgi:hypothetical protein
MATPNYKGAGQPSANGGSWLSSLVSRQPAYKSAEPRASNAPGYAGSGPAYKPAPATAQSPDVATSEDQNEACGCGPIAIVIPRDVTEQ